MVKFSIYSSVRYQSDLELAGLSHEHALEDLGEIPEVEGVVRLGRSRQQLGSDGGVHCVGGFD